VTYEETGPFAKTMAQFLEQQHPGHVVSNMTKALRTGKVLIDWSQNHEKKTTVAVYSLRAKRDEPYVSMPVSWDDLRSAMSGDNFAEANSICRELKTVAGGAISSKVGRE
jgi:bifunctional non-homologous end joining protein LigD